MPSAKFFFGVLFAALIPLGLYLVIPKEQSHVPPTSTLKESDARAQNVEIREISPDKKKGYLLKAKHLNLLNTSKSDTLIGKTVHCTMLTEKQPAANLHSMKAFFNRKTKDLFLEGDTFGDFQEFNLEGTNFDYCFNAHTISTNDPAILKHPELKTVAGKSTIHLTTKSCLLTDGVRTVFTPSYKQRGHASTLGNH